MNRILLVIVILIQLPFAQSISVTGDWNYTIPFSDISEAGNDFTGEYESAINQSFVDINHNKLWNVLISKNDIDWNNNFTLKVKRTGNGIGSNKPRGGVNYNVIANNSKKLFSGNQVCLLIPLQYKIEKVSVLIPSQAYIVEIVYTLQTK